MCKIRFQVGIDFKKKDTSNLVAFVLKEKIEKR